MCNVMKKQKLSISNLFLDYQISSTKLLTGKFHILE